MKENRSHWRLPVILVALVALFAAGAAGASVLEHHTGGSAQGKVLTIHTTVKGRQVTVTRKIHVPARTVHKHGRVVTIPAHTRVVSNTRFVPVTGPSRTTTRTVDGTVFRTIAGPTTTTVRTVTGPTTTTTVVSGTTITTTQVVPTTLTQTVTDTVTDTTTVSVPIS